MAEKYVRLVQDMYENITTVVRCAVGRTEDLKVESAGSHCESLSVECYETVIVCCVLATVTARCKWCMGQWHK